MIFGLVLMLYAAIALPMDYKQRTHPSPQTVEVFGRDVPISKIEKKRHGIGFKGGFKSSNYPRNRKKYVEQWAKKNGLIICAVFFVTMLILRLYDIAFLPFIGLGAARTWGGGSSMTGNWGDATCWTGDTVPEAADTVTFDATNVTNCSINVAANAITSTTIAATYTGTITVNINQTGTKGTFSISKGTYNTNGYNEFFTAVTVNANGTLTAGASSISVAGNWNSSGGTWNFNTSTVIFTAASSITVTYTRAIGNFYDVTTNAGITVTLQSSMCVKNVLIINGTFSTQNATYVCVLNIDAGTQITPLILGGSSVTAACTIIYNGVAAVNIAGGSCYRLWVGTLNTTCTLTGNVVASEICRVLPVFGVGTTTFNTANFSVSAVTLNVGTTGTIDGVIIATASQFTINTLTVAATSYLIGYSSTWNITGNATISASSALWNAGTSTFNFNGTGTQVLGLNDGNSANIKYYNINITNSGVVSIRMGAYTTTVTGAFNCSTTTATIVWSTNNGNLTVSGGLTIANGCGWTPGNGTVTFVDTCSIADNNAVKKDLKTVTINGAGKTVTLSTLIAVSGTLRIQAGTLTTTQRITFTTLNNVGSWIKASGGTSASVVGTLQIDAAAILQTGDAPSTCNPGGTIGIGIGVCS